jgi:hypothetical protein
MGHEDWFRVKGWASYVHLDKPHSFPAKPGERQKDPEYSLQLYVSPQEQATEQFKMFWQRCWQQFVAAVGQQQADYFQKSGFSPMVKEIYWPFTAKVVGQVTCMESDALIAVGVPAGTIIFKAGNKLQPTMYRREQAGPVMIREANLFTQGCEVEVAIKPFAFKKQTSGVRFDLGAVCWLSPGLPIPAGSSTVPQDIFGTVIEGAGPGAVFGGGSMPPQQPAGMSPQYAPPQQPAGMPPQYAPPQQPAGMPPQYAPPQQPAGMPPQYAPPQQPAGMSPQYAPPQQSQYAPPQQPQYAPPAQWPQT